MGAVSELTAAHAGDGLFGLVTRVQCYATVLRIYVSVSQGFEHADYGVGETGDVVSVGFHFHERIVKACSFGVVERASILAKYCDDLYKSVRMSHYILDLFFSLYLIQGSQTTRYWYTGSHYESNRY